MSAADPRIDAFIAKAQPFARPILSHLRDVIHRALPQVEEAIKWSRPSFLNEGRIVAVFGAFKAHASLTLWKMGEATGREEDGMGQLGRLTSLADLPDDAELIRLIQETASARETAPPRPKKPPRPEPPVPEALAAALAASPKAQAAWDGFAPSHRRDYSEWVSEAKRAETCAARVAQSVAWIAEGKQRNWKYQG
ncbi:MAG: YdeI/OmpD-associated family protein [Sphingomonas sp.]|nr:YdeI/OmpD-associated family protein [Sphingomonas sp.]